MMSTSGIIGSPFGDLPGSALDASGHFVASGTGVFLGGILNGNTGGLTLDGTIIPYP
jgi:hypothetical protein